MSDNSRRNRDYGQSGSSGREQKFRVTISDEDYMDDSQDYGGYQISTQQGQRSRQGGRPPQGTSRSVQRQGAAAGRGGASGRQGIRSQYEGSAQDRRLARRDSQSSYVPQRQMTRTRTVVNPSGERYEIPEENVLPPKLIRQSGRNNRSRGCVVALVYAAIICSISALLSFYLIVGMNDMFALVKDDAEIVVDIPKDADLDTVTEILEENGIVQYPFFFKLYANLTNDDSFKVGSYTLNIKTDYNSIINKITNPASADKTIVTITFPEGYNVEQIGDLLEEYSVCEKEAFLYSLQTVDFDYDFIKDIPTDEKRIYRLEGYLFPDTYQFYVWEGSKAAINRFLSAYETKVVENEELNIAAKAKKLGYTVDQIIIMASVIERETPDKEEMKNVASVFYNRLKNKNHDSIGGKLQSDATRWYPFPTADKLRESDLSEAEKNAWIDDHAGKFTRSITTDPWKNEEFVDTVMETSANYDTYVKTGLPVGPICCPGLTSITAALNPNKTNYYYFYTAADGTHYYANTYSEHQANIAKAS